MNACEGRIEMARSIDEFGLTREELIAALMEDSIGYLTPQRAERHIKRWEDGEDTCHCERCVAMFQHDLQACLERAVLMWEHLSEDKRQHLLEVVGEIAELDTMSQQTISLLWPTMG